MVRVLVLGEVCVDDDGQLVTPSAPRERAVLGLLGLQESRSISTDDLIDGLWPEHPPPNARKAVQNYVARLRKQLPAGLIDSSGDGYRLQAGVSVDAGEFERTIHEARRAPSPDRRAVALNDALVLWRGDPCDLPPAAARRLLELRLVAEDDQLDARLALGDHAAAVAAAEERVAREPLREGRWAQLMVALFRSGRQADALRAYQRARNVLVGELGVEPGDELRRLASRILAQDPSLHWRPPPPPVWPKELPPALAELVGRPMIGRQQELGELLEEWRRAGAGARRIIGLTGEPGAGKSRLAAALAAHVVNDGGAVICGRCLPDLGVPFQPFDEALGSLFRGGPPDTGGTGERAQYRLFQRVVGVLATAAAVQPVLMVIEDVHWATGPTLRLLGYLAAAPELSRVLILATIRTAERPVSPELAEIPNLRRVPVGPLSVEEVAAWLQEAGNDHDQARRFHELAGGNPFLLEQLLADQDSGTMARGRDVVAGRIARLSGPTRSVLQLAALAGATFSLPLLVKAHGRDDDVVLDALEEAEAAGLVVPFPAANGQFSFRHAIVREALVAALPSTRAMRLHRDLAQALEARPDTRRDVTAIARHYCAAAPIGCADKAITYAQQAGRVSRAAFAFEEAAAYFDLGLQALDMLDEPDDATRCDLMTAKAEALRRVGDRGADATLDTAAALARQLGDSRRLAEVVFAVSRISMLGLDLTGTDTAVARLATEAINAVGDDDPVIRARLLAALATELVYTAEDDRRRDVINQAIDCARRAREPRVLLQVLNSAVTAWADPWDLTGRRRAAEEAVAVADTVGATDLAYQANHLLSLAHYEAGDLDGYRAARARAVALAARISQPSIRVEVLCNDAADLYIAGDTAGAERLAHEALALAARSGVADSTITGIRAACLGALYWDCGRAAEALPVDQQMAALNPRSPWPHVVGLFLWETGDHDGARAALRANAANNFADVPKRTTWSLAIAMSGQLATEVGDTAVAAILLGLFQPFAGRILVADPIRYDLADRILGRLHTTLGDYTAAGHALNQAAAIAERAGAPLFAARVCVDLARLAAATGNTTERDRHVARAVQIAEPLGGYGIVAAARRAGP